MTLLAGDYTIRFATKNDAATVQQQREAMFAAMGEPVDTLSRLRDGSLAWHQRVLGDGSYTGLLVEYGREIIGGGGILWQDMPPNPETGSSTRGYIMNMYVQPQYRRVGLGRILTQQLLDEARARGIRVVTLHPSQAGKPLYESFGFAGTDEMKALL